MSYLHACVIEGDEGAEKIQVACGEHESKQDLALSRDTFNTKISSRFAIQNSFISNLEKYESMLFLIEQ